MPCFTCPSPHIPPPQQVNAQTPVTGSNDNVYMVRAPPLSCPPVSHSPLTVCLPCFPSTHHDNKQKRQKCLLLSLPSTPPPQLSSHTLPFSPPLCPCEAQLGAHGPHCRGPSSFFSAFICLFLHISLVPISALSPAPFTSLALAMLHHAGLEHSMG